METTEKRGKTEAESLRSASTLTFKPDFRPIGSPATAQEMNDNVTAINNAIHSTSSDIFIPAGRYAIDRMIYINVNTGLKRIHGAYDFTDPTNPNTNTIIDTTFYKDGQNSVFHLYGSSTLVEEFSKPISKGATTYTFSGPINFTQGDLLVLSDPEEYSYGYRYYYKKGEVLEIRHYDSATNTVTFSPTVDFYSANCYIFKLSPLRDIKLENMVFAAANPGAGWNANSAIRLRFCSQISINNVVINEAAFYNGLIVDQSYDCEIESIHSKITATVNKENVYGVCVSNSQKITFRGIESCSWWHAFATGGGCETRLKQIGTTCVPNPEFETQIKIVGSFVIVNRQISVYASTFIADRATQGVPYASAANFHGNTESSEFNDCTIKGSGFNIGGHNNTLRGNIILPIYRDPAQLKLTDIGIYFNENLSVSFTIENNQYIANGFNQEVRAEDKAYAEFLHLGIVGWWIADDKAKNPCRVQKDATRCPLPVKCNFVFRGNKYILIEDNPNLPQVHSKMLRLCSVLPDQAIKNDMLNNPAAVPEMSVEISNNEVNAQTTNGTPITPPLSSIDVATDFLAGKEWLSFKSVIIRDNRLDRVRLSVNTSSLFYPSRPIHKGGVVITGNKVITYNNERRNIDPDPLITCKQFDSIHLDNPDFSNVGGDPNLNIDDFAKIGP